MDRNGGTVRGRLLASSFTARRKRLSGIRVDPDSQTLPATRNQRGESYGQCSWTRACLEMLVLH